MTGYQPFHVPIREAARILGYSTDTLYRMNRKGELAFNKYRRRTFVPVTELDRIKAKLEREREASMQQSVGDPVREPTKARPKKRKLIPKDS